MSTDYHAVTVYAAQVRREDMYRNVPIKSCKHTFGSECLFCPYCGKPVNEIVRMPVFNEDTYRIGKCTIERPYSDSDMMFISAMKWESRSPDRPTVVMFKGGNLFITPERLQLETDRIIAALKIVYPDENARLPTPAFYTFLEVF